MFLMAEGPATLAGRTMRRSPTLLVGGRRPFVPSKIPPKVPRTVRGVVCGQRSRKWCGEKPAHGQPASRDFVA